MNTPIENRKPEVFVEIIDYPGYQISNHGTVLSYRQGFRKVLSLVPDKDGYLRVGLSKNGKVKTLKVHRLVAMHFIPNPNNYNIVNHKFGDITNNYYEDLEWCTIYYNNKYDYNNLENNKELQYGENKEFTKLAPIDVIHIRKHLESDIYTQKEIADMYNISVSTVQRIKYGTYHGDVGETTALLEPYVDPVVTETKSSFKYTEEQIRQMFLQSRLSDKSLTEIAEQFGTDRRYIADIRDQRRRKSTTDCLLNQNGYINPLVKIEEGI